MSKSSFQGSSGTYFITFTCFDWMPLFEISDAYNNIYKWFDYLKLKGHKINGYVIMPNHLHLLLEYNNSDKSISSLISNGKRLLAYHIIKTLRNEGYKEILLQLYSHKYKAHHVFERSFDFRPITSQYYFHQKLAYIHNNPISGKWSLATSPVDYQHCSARYYLTGKHAAHQVEY